jgi:hypothetical protein
VELQGSYVPPLPDVLDIHKIVKPTLLDNFRPESVPAPPAMRFSPLADGGRLPDKSLDAAADMNAVL